MILFKLILFIVVTFKKCFIEVNLLYHYKIKDMPVKFKTVLV